MNKEWDCDECNQDQSTLYEGWFYTQAKLNPWAKGTASAGLLQKRRVCKDCFHKLKDLGLAKADKL